MREAERWAGAGTALLEAVLEQASKATEIEEVYLHVQTSNDKALSFYKKFDFTVRETIKNYYKDIDPPGHLTILPLCALCN